MKENGTFTFVMLLCMILFMVSCTARDIIKTKVEYEKLRVLESRNAIK